MGEACSYFGLAIVVTISTLAGLLPISINGIGVTDSSFIYFIEKFGISYDPGLMIMILTRILLIPISLIGGLIYFREKHPVKKGGHKLRGLISEKS